MTRTLLTLYAFIFIFNCYSFQVNAQIISNSEEYLSTHKIDPWLIFNSQKCTGNANWFKEWTDGMSGISRLGIIANIVTDINSGELCLELDNNKLYKLDYFLSEVNGFLSGEGKQFTIIFYADYNTTKLINKRSLEFSNSINDTIFTRQTSLYNILENEKVSWFSKYSHNNTNPKVHIFDEYLQEQTIVDNTTSYSKCVSSAQGSILYGLENIQQDSIINNKERAQYAEKQLWLNVIFEDWNNSSIQPVFLVMQSNTHIQSYKTAINALQKTSSISGLITNEGLVPLNLVYWEHNNYMPSVGMFSFPFTKIKTLKPYKPGFTFSPKEIDLRVDKTNLHFNFKADPLDIKDQLVLLEQFNKPKAYNNTIDGLGSSIIEDRKRGHVLQISPNGEIPIGTIEDYKLSDNSFTISYWIKTNSSIDRNCNIIGNNTREHRKGLHLAMRVDRPYFGFYYNDIWSDTELIARKWYHITFTYDKTLKQQRIYINGKLDKTESNRASLIGSGTLFIGKAININTTYPFYIDDLCIWNRALGKAEVASLKYGLSNTDQTKQSNTWLYVVLIIIIGIIAPTYVFKKRLKNPKIIAVAPHKTQTNAILVFGDLALIDNKGVDVTNCVPPLAKEMFILLLSATFKHKKGVSSQEISNHFWSDLTASKARNNRNVAIAKLRKCIENIDGLSIEYENKLTFINIKSPCYCDYLAAINETNNLADEQPVVYFNIVKRGMFLPFTEWNWLSSLKSQINSEIIENLSTILVAPELSKNKLMRENICLHILSNDDLNQKATFCLIQIYYQSNRINLATSLFQKYADTYQKVYNEAYKYSFNKFRSISYKELE